VFFFSGTKAREQSKAKKSKAEIQNFRSGKVPVAHRNAIESALSTLNPAGVDQPDLSEFSISKLKLAESTSSSVSHTHWSGVLYPK